MKIFGKIWFQFEFYSLKSIRSNDPFEITGKIDVSNILNDFEPNIGFLDDLPNISTPNNNFSITPSSSKRKRKRKNLIIDELTEIPFDEMRKFITDTSNIIVKRPKIIVFIPHLNLFF